ncbi:hypothetical protein CK203_052225 [Vitis vinifera]|uniref:Endonuclease/exonuclease/phosphatase domain-containing protein n=1 Tax=Vitis vinifera TaxID=29760 RepID=A0A438GPK7_VITVI|nr:hypothetical protein CK203_052225 [Vitis vinifera]
MKDRAILPALLEVNDGDWVFTVVVVVVGDEERRRGSEKGEPTRVAVASHSGTGGGRRGESGRSTAGVGGRYRVGEDNRQRKEGEKVKAMLTSAGKCDKGYQLPSQSRLKTDGMDGIEVAGEIGPEKTRPWTPRGPVEQASEEEGAARFKEAVVNLLPPSSEHRRGIRCSSEPISRRKTKVDSEEDSKAEDSGAESQANRGLSASSLFSPRFPRLRKKNLGERASSPRKEEDPNNASSDEDMEGFLGRVGSDPRDSAVMVLPSSPETRGKGPNLLGNCGSMVAEFWSPSTPILPISISQSLAPMENRVNSEFFFKKVNDAFKGQIPVDIPNSEMEVIQLACPYQMFETVNPLSVDIRSPIKESSKAAVNLGGVFQEEEQMLHKIVRPIGFGSEIRVREFHMKIISWNTRGLGSKKKRRVVKDFLRLEKPDVVMIQETKKEECDRRFVGSVWSARNKDWAALLASGASGGILIIWDSKKLRREEVVLGSFSVSIKFAMDGRESLWLSAVYGPNNSALRKDFWVELSDIVGLSYPRWCVGGDFNVIRRSSEKLRGSRLTPSMKDFDDFIRDCKLIDSPLRSTSYTGQTCKRIQSTAKMDFGSLADCFGNQSIQVGPTPFRFENMWLQHPSFKENFGRWWREFQGNGWEGHKFMRKLQFVKAKLKEWNKASFGELKYKRGDLKVFRKALRESFWRIVESGRLRLVPISGESASRLESSFTEEEIFKAIFQMNRDKALGPDGFTIAVFQDCWEVIKEIYQSVSRASKRGTSRDHSFHSRAFVQGRQILGAVLIANEIVDEKRRSEEEGVVFKIDLKRPMTIAREEDMMTLKNVLLVFGHISGLKVNLDKSNIYGINLEQNHLSRLAEMLDCKASGGLYFT